MIRHPHPHFIQALCERPLPLMLVLDILNYCNLDCVHCPQKAIQKTPGFVPRRLALEYAQNIASEVAKSDYPLLVRVAGDGEPLLHPNCLDILRQFAPLPHVVTDLTTNGLLLSRQCAQEILEMGVDMVSVSLDALTAPTYAKVRRGGKLVVTLRHIFRFLDLRASLGGPTKLLVSFIEQEENRNETAMFRHFWEPLADFVIVRHLHTAGNKVKLEEAAQRNRNIADVRYPCPHPFKRLAINYNGSISYCAHDWDDSAVIGNVANMTLAQAWQSDTLAEVRRALIDNTFPHGATCMSCNDWASTRWDFGYELLVDKVLKDPARKLLPSTTMLLPANSQL